MFTRLGVGSLKPIEMDIEMVTKSMQTSLGVVENILVKIDNFFSSGLYNFENC